MKELWFKLSRKIRFLLAGGVNTLCAYLLYSLFCLAFGENTYQISLIFSWCLSSVISFTLQKYLVFQSHGKWLDEYLKCCTTWVFSYIINSIILETCVKTFTLNIYTAQILSAGLTAIFTYCIFKKFIFKETCT